MKLLSSALLVLFGLLIAPGLHATPASSCAPDFSTCSIFEDGLVLTLPGLAIAGDVIIVDSSDNTHVSDVFRIFNDFLDTGNGTGIGLTAFLFSEDLGNLPDPSTFSPGAPRIIEGPSIGGGLSQTDFDFNGTSYSLFSSDDAAIPEPSTFVLAGLGGVLALWRRRLLSA